MKLFINYRREDTDDLAGRLYDRLSSEFGSDNIFKDVDSIRPGQNWKSALEQSVAGCDVVLALIGRNWQTCTDDEGRLRLQNEQDFVRYELESARRNNKHVMPILVKGAHIPTAQALPESIRWLPDIHCAEVRGDPHFKDDVAQLVKDLRRIRDRIAEEHRRAQEALAAKHAKAPDAAGAGVVCVKCKHTSPRSDQFCESCGSNLWDTCPKCDSIVAASQRFCKACGIEIPKYREAMRIVDAARTRYAMAALQAAPERRLEIAQELFRDVETALRILPEFGPAALLITDAKSLGLAAAIDLGDAAYFKSRYADAIQSYEAAAVWGRIPAAAEQRIGQIRAYYDETHKTAAAKMSSGQFAEAVSLYVELESRFPGDSVAAVRLRECRDDIQHLEALMSTRIRDLKSHRKLVELEKELSWMEQKRVMDDRLPEFAKLVRKVLADANARHARAKTALNAGQIDEAERLGKKIFAAVSDHHGAQEILASARRVRDRVAQLAEIVRQREWCAALTMVKDLGSASLADDRFLTLRAKVFASIAGLDSSITFLLGTIVCGIAFGFGLLPVLRWLGVNISAADTSAVLACTWAGAALMVAAVFLTFEQKQQVVARLKMYFVRPSRSSIPATINGEAGADIGAQPVNAGESSVKSDAAAATPRHSPFSTVDTNEPARESHSELFSLPKVSRTFSDDTTVAPTRPQTPAEAGSDGGRRPDKEYFPPQQPTGPDRRYDDIGLAGRVDRTLITFIWLILGGLGGTSAFWAWSLLAPRETTYPLLLVFDLVATVGLFPAVLIAGGRRLARLSLSICGIGLVIISAAAVFNLPNRIVAPCFIAAYLGLGGASLVARSLGQKFWKGLLVSIAAAGAILVFVGLCLALVEQLVKMRYATISQRQVEEVIVAAVFFGGVMSVIVGTRGFWGFILNCVVASVLWLGVILIFHTAPKYGQWILFFFAMQAVIPLCTWRWRIELLPWSAAIALFSVAVTTVSNLWPQALAAQSWLMGWELVCSAVAVTLVDLADVTRNRRDTLEGLRNDASSRVERIHRWLSKPRWR
jgi:tetratricopeptide (TPR) repeat protein